MGLLSQEPILFATTLKENILYGKEDASNEDNRTAMELANAAKFIDNLRQRLTSSGSLPPPFGAPDLIDYQEAQTGDTRDEREVKVVHQEISWFDNPRNSSGVVVARLSTDASTVRSLVGDALALIFQNIATVIVCLVIVFSTNWLLAIIILLVLPLVGLRGFLSMRFYKGFSVDAKLVMYEEACQVANDAVSSIRTVASFSAEEKIMKMYEKKCEAHVKQGVRVGLIRELVLLLSFAQIPPVSTLDLF
ncbi:unnamed protein product [Fraxinus pennsylvanica]|uniref:ABC transmembrane type-1 domain-containing protein n=1 Tax=Fraxinus pennsylvanica TaxID=56036 RepID=A0AAD2AA87_9LAMI|nr:unnamed protein product [Fraxinus pennsylvanica]